MHIESNVGKIEVSQVDEKTKQEAEENTRDWDKGEEVVLAEIDGYGWKWIPAKSIEE